MQNLAFTQVADHFQSFILHVSNLESSLKEGHMFTTKQYATRCEALCSVKNGEHKNKHYL